MFEIFSKYPSEKMKDSGEFGALRPRAWGRVHMMRSGKRSWNPELSPEDLDEDRMEDLDDILVSDYPESQQYQVNKRADKNKEGDHLIF